MTLSSTAEESNQMLSEKQLSIIEICIIAGLAAVPLFFSFPYRVNIFLSWEGAYRLSEGQIPYKDFGLPLGFVYWIVPALFFKIFGPYMISLIKAQVFINIISGLAFRSILKTIGVNSGLRLISILVFCISYSFFNFWPWYNHTVTVWGFVGLSFLLRYLLKDHKSLFLLLASSFFYTLSFFTKQDGGGLAIVLGSALLIYHTIVQRNFKPLLFFVVFITGFFCLIIIPFLPYDFGYWFNYGQFPHYSRFSLSDVLKELLLNSQWLKFYFLIIVLILFIKVKDLKSFFWNQDEMIFLLLTVGILVQAAIFQVTSYTPPDNNIYFHSFAVVYIFSQIQASVNFQRFSRVVVMSALVMLWWSGVYWGYIERIATRVFPKSEDTNTEVVSRHTYVIETDTTIDDSAWKFSELEVFKKIYMPEPTVEGVERIMNLEVVKGKEDLKVLNMSELTPLAHAMNYSLETGPGFPLWYHKGVSMFEREEEMIIERIDGQYYDLVLFEYIPFLNNFYPFNVRDALLKNYLKVDEFLAPRRPTNVNIEVYVKPK